VCFFDEHPRYAKKVRWTPEGCLVWTGAKNSANDYGEIKTSRKDGPRRNIRVHRRAYEEDRGPIPKGLLVCHRCDNSLCVNPDHLFLGTDADNSADKVAKGRQARGVTQGQAKLTEEDVHAIRARYALGDISQRDLAAIFGVSQTLVRLIVNRKIWTHI
jgi:hypothetical protein